MTTSEEILWSNEGFSSISSGHKICPICLKTIGVLTTGSFIPEVTRLTFQQGRSQQLLQGGAVLGGLRHSSQPASAGQVGPVGVTGAVTGQAGLALVVPAHWTLENPDI